MNAEIFNTEIITSKANATIIKLNKLTNKKYRNEYSMFMCDGVKLLKEAIDYFAEIKYVILRNDFNLDSDLLEKVKNCQKNGTTVLVVNEQVFLKISEENAPQGVIAVCSYLKNVLKRPIITSDEIGKNEKIIMFESVRDPGNIGTIIRNAAAFGIDRLVFSNDCADIYSQKVVRAAMGAIFKVKIDIVDDFIGKIKALQKCDKRVLGAALNHDSLTLGKYNLTAKDVIVIGNEGHGLSSDVLTTADDTIFIPIKENTESLNAAMATSIFIWEMSKI